MNTKALDDLKFVSEVRKQMDENQLMLSYRGEMSQEIVMALLNMTENKLNQTSYDVSIKSRVFAVMVECLQNITQHSDKSMFSRSNMFMIGHTDQGYMIYSGNVIRPEKVEELRSKITKINTMTEEELKEFYKYWIKNESLSGKSGFGLGLIHIARKTGNPLDFDFEQIDNDHFFFSLRTLVDH
jgi:hypothetical protein